ncbi:MAG TPA: gliding motility lipoprotein GldD [Bacteroidales bacterium]
MNRKSFPAILLILPVAIALSCSNNYTPKPSGYFRIDLPEKKYQPFDTLFPFYFEYPVYARIMHDPQAPNEPYWINVDFPRFRGRIHLSYKEVNGNLSKYLEDSRSLALKHMSKSTGITEQVVNIPDKKVYGLIYTIQGSGAASTYQFYLTDSTRNFIRGALYFSVSPNNDSLAPVISFIQSDINHMIETFRWK